MNASEQIDDLISKTTDWRGQRLAEIRQIILAADLHIVEEWKWMGSPVWSRDGVLVVGNPHKDKVKLTFSHGASLEDPDKLFNNGFNGKVWRAIDLGEHDAIDAAKLQNLVRAAIAYNQSETRKRAKPRRTVIGG